MSESDIEGNYSCWSLASGGLEGGGGFGFPLEISFMQVARSLVVDE